MSTELPLPETRNDINPYAPPKLAIDLEPVELVSTGPLAVAEAIRKAHIGHEASLKSIGTLHFVGVFFGVLITIGVISVALTGQPQAGPWERGAVVGVGVCYLALTGLHLALGIGLTRLQTWARWTDVVLIGLALAFYSVVGITATVMRGVSAPPIAILVGSTIPGYMLYLLLSARATTIFSAEYKTIIDQTPHIKYRTSLLLKIFLVILVTIVVVAVIAAFRPR